MSRLGVVIAVEEEARAILAEPSFAWEKGPRGILRSGLYPVSLILSGVGKVLAARAATLLAADCDPLCALGTAGGLSHENVGDLYLCGETVECDIDVAVLGYPRGVTPFWGRPDPVMSTLGQATRDRVAAACAGLGPRLKTGRIASSDRFVADLATGKELRRAFGANLVEMECAACAKVALEEGVEFFALRWISDNADHSSPADWVTNVRRSSVVFRDFLLAFMKSF